MRECLLLLVLSLVLAIAWGGQGFAQTKNEMTSSGTYFWSGTPKVFQADLVRSIRQLELSGIRAKDDKVDKKASKKEGQWEISTVNENGPKLKPIWEAILQAGQERIGALRNLRITDKQMKMMYNVDPATGFNGKELLFLSSTGTSRGGWGITWEGGREGRGRVNDSYDSNMVSNLLMGKITSENLQKFIRIFDVNSQRYVDPKDYMENKEKYDAEVKSGNAFLDQFADSGRVPSGQDEWVEKQYGFGVLIGEDVYQPYVYSFSKEQLSLLEPLFEQQWTAKVEAYYASRYAQQRQQKIDGGR